MIKQYSSFKQSSKEVDSRTKNLIFDAFFSEIESRLKRTKPAQTARFDTADFLIAVEEIKPPTLFFSSPYYSQKYDEEMVSKEVEIEIHAKVLKENGEILWDETIKKFQKEKILPFVQKYQEKKRDKMLLAIRAHQDNANERKFRQKPFSIFDWVTKNIPFLGGDQ